MAKFYIGIDFGGTNLKLGCFDEHLNLIGKISVATEGHMGPSVVLERIATATEELLNSHQMSLADVIAIGIGAPGPSDIENGLIVAAPNLPLFKNVPLRQMISDRFDKPAIFENDANAACWGEYVMGAGKGVQNIVFFTLGTGIGGAVISNGKLLSGFNNNAAELGHLIVRPGGRVCGCGQKGCVEAYASASSTAARAKEAVKDKAESKPLTAILEQTHDITCKDVFACAKDGDALSEQIIEETANCLAMLSIDLLHVTAPEKIVFAGGMIAAGEQLLSKIQKHYDDMLWTLKPEKTVLCFATLGEDAGIIGAAALAKQIQT